MVRCVPAPAESSDDGPGGQPDAAMVEDGPRVDQGGPVSPGRTRAEALEQVQLSAVSTGRERVGGQAALAGGRPGPVLHVAVWYWSSRARNVDSVEA